jgi:prepilin-type N-terminal cleavage/methylation domain-containing protein
MKKGKQINLVPVSSQKIQVNGTCTQGTRAFTLVELIVVITILAILWTIAFISLQWYSKDARDSVRISDMSRIKTSLELFHLDSGKYPEANDNSFPVTYSWAVARTQWFFWETTFSNVEKLDKIPKDPLTDKEYIYSTTNTRQEFEIACVMEWDEISFIWNQVNAWNKTAILKITGTYNWKILKVSTGGIDYVLAVPSIINWSWLTLEEIIPSKFLAYDGYKNLPAQYDWWTYNVLWDSDIRLVDQIDYVVFSWDIKDLSDTTNTGTLARASLIANLQKAYTWTDISNIWEIAEILNTEWSKAIESLASTIVNNDLGGSFIASSTVSWWPIPTNTAWWLSFTDTDDNTWQIWWTLTITAAWDESDIDSYIIYWWSNTTTKLNWTPITTITSDGTNKTYNFSANTSIPSWATYLLVFTKNTWWEMSTWINVAIGDNTAWGIPAVVPTYTITTCPAVNSAKDWTSPTKATILANINYYIWCNITWWQIAGYTYSGTISPENKMVLVVELTDTAWAWTTKWWSYWTDISGLANITAWTNTTTMTGDIVAWDW